MAIPDTTPGPAGSVTGADGRRYYLIGEERFWSVTTALDVAAKAGLLPWAADLAAQHAFLELPTLITASRIKPCGRTWVRCKHEWRERCDACPCARCRACVTKWLGDRHIAESSRRADEGNAVHKVVGWWALHDGQWTSYDPTIEPYLASFRRFVEAYGLTPDSWLMTEGTVIHRAHQWAGTADGIVRFDATRTDAAADLVARVLYAAGEYRDARYAEDVVRAVQTDGRTVDLLDDVKTREKPEPKFYPDQALQTTAYRNAAVVRIKNTDLEQPMPDTHGAVLIQLRPDGCTPRLVVADDEAYEAFLHALGLFRWLTDHGTASVSSRSFPLPKAAPKVRARKATASPAGTRPAAVKKTAAAARPARSLPQRVLGAQLTDDDIPF